MVAKSLCRRRASRIACCGCGALVRHVGALSGMRGAAHRKGRPAARGGDGARPSKVRPDAASRMVAKSLCRRRASRIACCGCGALVRHVGALSGMRGRTPARVAPDLVATRCTSSAVGVARWYGTPVRSAGCGAGRRLGWHAMRSPCGSLHPDAETVACVGDGAPTRSAVAGWNVRNRFTPRHPHPGPTRALQVVIAWRTRVDAASRSRIGGRTDESLADLRTVSRETWARFRASLAPGIACDGGGGLAQRRPRFASSATETIHARCARSKRAVAPTSSCNLNRGRSRRRAPLPQAPGVSRGCCRSGRGVLFRRNRAIGSQKPPPSPPGQLGRGHPSMAVAPRRCHRSPTGVHHSRPAASSPSRRLFHVKHPPPCRACGGGWCQVAADATDGRWSGQHPGSPLARRGARGAPPESRRPISHDAPAAVAHTGSIEAHTERAGGV